MKITTTNKSAQAKTIKSYQNKEIKKSEAIRELFKAGVDVKSIADILEIRYQHAYNTIQNAIYKGEIDQSKIEVNVRTADKKIKITELLAEGKTPKEIAIELKSNINYIYKIKKELAK